MQIDCQGQEFKGAFGRRAVRRRAGGAGGGAAKHAAPPLHHHDTHARARAPAAAAAVRVNDEDVEPGGKKRLHGGEVTFPSVQQRRDQAVAAVVGPLSLGVTRYWQGVRACAPAAPSACGRARPCQPQPPRAQEGWAPDLELAVVLERRLAAGEQLGGHLALGYEPGGLHSTAIVTGV